MSTVEQPGSRDRAVGATKVGWCRCQAAGTAEEVTPSGTAYTAVAFVQYKATVKPTRTFVAGLNAYHELGGHPPRGASVCSWSGTATR